MALTRGDRLGPYEILAPLGAGGMGEVWKARDTRLNREVAIKISNEKFSDRFEREAKSIAALNHPNICQLYDVGPNYLVMELIDGPTLADRIKPGAIPLEESLNVVRQIAAALDAAHEKGIIHRDLKPANIKITPAGVVKVLDFGLAKSTETPASDPEVSPTMTISPTRAGMILGTAAYMAPEQARGKQVDKRADIWAFGCVLYEMLTGRRPFSGDTPTEILASVIKEQPDLSNVPAEARRLIETCLEKEPGKRLRDIGDIRFLLQNGPRSSATVASRRRWLWPAVSAVFALALAAALLLILRNPRADTNVIVTDIAPPENTTFDFANDIDMPAISPDGRKLVFGARGLDRKTHLWLRSLDSSVSRPLAQTDGATYPFWSPDSQSIAFFAQSKLKRLDLQTSAVLDLAPDIFIPLSGSWSPQGFILFSPTVFSELKRVPAGGGAVTSATKIEPGHSHANPWFLPDGKRFLFLDRDDRGVLTTRAGSLDSLETKTIGPAESSAAYSQGYLLFARDGALKAQRFDPERLEMHGDPALLQAGVGTTGSADAIFSVSRDGPLVYQTRVHSAQQLTWFDRSGKVVGTLGELASFWSIEFSPDRQKLLASRIDGAAFEVWTYEVARQVASRLTFSPDCSDGLWSADGKSIVYRCVNTILRKPSDGSGGEQRLYTAKVMQQPSTLSPDGKWLLTYGADDSNQVNLFALPLEPNAKPHRWQDGPQQTINAQFSPDGQWVAYQTIEKERMEVYVAPFSEPGRKKQISVSGGRYPRWRSDGKELFYGGPDRQVVAVDISIKNGDVQVGPERPLPIPIMFDRAYTYDVSADGQRFLVAVPQPNHVPLAIMQNWTAALKK